MKTIIINLDRRPDRWENFKKKSQLLNYERFSAIDGTKLISTPQLQRIFDNNDYNMRQGMVGCAMSHIKLYIDLIKDTSHDTYCILEDDIDFTPEFEKKLLHCCQELTKVEWDMLYLGHHLFKQFIDNEVYNKTITPKIEQWTRSFSLQRSMGGTGGYIITKEGAKKLLNFINQTGMTNGIDTVQQKSADTLKIFYCYPHLIYSECFRGDNTPDTDIQYNYSSLTVPLEERLKQEIEFYGNIEEVCVTDTYAKETKPFFYKNDNPAIINQILKVTEQFHPSYTLEDKILIVVPDGNPNRYFHRFQKNGEWTVDDAIKYKIEN